MEPVRIPPSVEKYVTELRCKPGEGDGAFVDLPLEYHRGPPKEGWPITIRLTAPPEAAVQAIAQERQESRDPTALLLHCLPSQFATAAFLERLSLDCLRALESEAWRLALENSFCRKFMELILNRAADEAAFPI